MLTGCLGLITSVQAQSLQFTHGTSGPPHAPVADPFFQYEYDTNGNLVVVRDRATGQPVQQLTYTAFNKLARAVGASGAAVEYRYDANGRRLEKILKDSSGATISREKYHGPMETKDNEKTSYYFLGNRRIAQKNRTTGQVFFYHQDHLGSTSLLTDHSGAQILRRDYYEYGPVRSESAGGIAKYAYGGKERDRETDFYDFEARAYNSKISRFASPDPKIPDIRNPKSLNRYAYVYGNPLRFTDTTGHAPEDAVDTTRINWGDWTSIPPDIGGLFQGYAGHTRLHGPSTAAYTPANPLRLQGRFVGEDGSALAADASPPAVTIKLTSSGTLVWSPVTAPYEIGVSWDPNPEPDVLAYIVSSRLDAPLATSQPFPGAGADFLDWVVGPSGTEAPNVPQGNVPSAIRVWYPDFGYSFTANVAVTARDVAGNYSLYSQQVTANLARLVVTQGLISRPGTMGLPFSFDEGVLASTWYVPPPDNPPLGQAYYYNVDIEDPLP